MQFTITHWGCTPSGDSIYLFRLTNATGASIELTNLGILRPDTGIARYSQALRLIRQRQE